MKLIIDTSFLVYRAVYSVNGLNYQGQNTGGIYGFFNQLLSLYHKFEPTHIAFCWDSNQSHRRRLYPDYKKKDKLTEADKELRRRVKQQIKILRQDIFPKLGFKNNYHQVGYEADDGIGALVTPVQTNAPLQEDYTVVSGDEDMYMLLEFCKIYNPKKDLLLTHEWFTKEYGINAYEWHIVKALGGCTSDNVAGIQGVAEGKAIKYLKGELPTTGKIFERIESEEGLKIRQRNDKLVWLPFPDTKKIEIQDDDLYWDDFDTVFRTYGFNSFLQDERWERWEDLIEGLSE